MEAATELLRIAGMLAIGAQAASAQANHHGSIWLGGPRGVLRPNTTYTIEAWGMWDSPEFVPGVSAMAGFGVNVINTIGHGTAVAGVGKVQIAWWASVFGEIEATSGTDLIGISGGTVPPPIGTPVEPHVGGVERLETSAGSGFHCMGKADWKSALLPVVLNH